MGSPKPRLRPACGGWRSAIPATCGPSARGLASSVSITDPGYRVYFVQRGPTLIVLLCGGDKSTQSRDIEAARMMARELE